jgi:radical SAM protein with 4Fe4S-binding SPASM domain
VLRRQTRRQCNDLTTEEILALLDELAANQTLFLVLTGGEVFLRQDLQTILAAATRLKFAVKLYTNGFHLTEAWADRLATLGVYGIDISVYGACEATYAKLTRIRGGFSRVVRSLALLRDRQIRFTVKTPVMSINYKEIPAIKALAQEYGGYFRYDAVIIPRFDGDQAPFSYRLSDAQFADLLDSMGARFDRKQEPNQRPPGCAVGRWSAVVAPDGEVYPCIEMRTSIGNVRELKFGQIWRDNPAMRRIRERLAATPAHAEWSDGLCGHCPALSLRTTGDMNKPSPEQMRLAAVKRRFRR